MLRHLKTSVALALCFAAGLGVWFIHLASGASGTSPKAQAEIAVLLYHAPAFTIDPVTGIARDNTSASCDLTTGQCIVSWNGTTTTVPVP